MTSAAGNSAVPAVESEGSLIMIEYSNFPYTGPGVVTLLACHLSIWAKLPLVRVCMTGSAGTGKGIELLFCLSFSIGFKMTASAGCFEVRSGEWITCYLMIIDHGTPSGRIVTGLTGLPGIVFG